MSEGIGGGGPEYSQDQEGVAAEPQAVSDEAKFIVGQMMWDTIVPRFMRTFGELKPEEQTEIIALAERLLAKTDPLSISESTDHQDPQP